MSRKSVTFEESMTRLDGIVKALEAGDVPLEESMKLFEEGTKLSAYLSQLLDTAEQKVTMMTVRDGAETEIPFDTQEGE